MHKTHKVQSKGDVLAGLQTRLKRGSNALYALGIVALVLIYGLFVGVVLASPLIYVLLR